VGEAFNLASRTGAGVKDLANHIIEITGSEVDVVYTKKRDWDESNRRLASIEKSRKDIGFESKMDLRKGLETVFDWFTIN